MKKTDLPVMIWFHGGGFQCGSGIDAFYAPDHLLDHDIIYIGANYRLGNVLFMACKASMFLGAQMEFFFLS